jgi:NitT/TauT family transport system substrate-binding protein
MTGAGLSVAGVALASGCGSPGPPPLSRGGGSALETTTLRIGRLPSLCQAPQYVAEDLLRGEGFTRIEYVPQPTPADLEVALAAGEIHLSQNFAGPVVTQTDAGDPIVAVAGIHVGCFELFGTGRVHAIRDLKGKTVAVPDLKTGPFKFISSMATYVGLNPREDIAWVALPSDAAKQALAEERIDAYLGFPPDPQDLRARKIGHVVLNSAVDKPWSQYFCCLLEANRAFVQQNPVATKRALRAILKATDLCAAEPDRVVQTLVERGFTSEPDYARQLLGEIPYARWREYDPEDTLRFYALRLQEAGLVKSSPSTIIQNGSDWRFLNELRQELKA